MKRYLRSHHRRDWHSGTALAVAMLVVVMLSAIGAIAVDAASFDMTTAGLVSEMHNANGIAGGGMSLSRCKACQNIDGIALAMNSMRERAGKAPEFLLQRPILEDGLDNSEHAFALPESDGDRGSFGALYDELRPAQYSIMDVTMDRPRESLPVSGFSMREAAGSDSASFCFRSYRMTSSGVYMPARAATAPVYEGARVVHRAYLITGPMECSH